MPAQQLFLDLVIIVTAAAVMAVVGRTLRLALIPGYLIVGAIIGPHAAGLVRHPENVEAVSHIAIILLMFSIGLHMDVGGLRRTITPVLAVGGIASLVVAAIGWPYGLMLGLDSPAAIAVSMALSISSTAVVLKIIHERRELHRPHGRLLFGALLIQDLLAVVMLAVVPLLAAWASTGAVADPAHPAAPAAGVVKLLSAFLIGVGGIAAMLVIGRLTLPRLLAAAARTASGEVLIVVSAAVALGAAVATSVLGFSAELGAFLAGFLLASTTFRHQIAGQLMPMRDLFMAVFFTAVGLEVDPQVILHSWWIILPALASLLVVKSAVMGLAAWASGASGPTALISGLSLANAGEFSIVLLSAAGAAGVVGHHAEAIAIAVIVCSLILTPTLMTRSHAWAERLAGVGPPSWMKRAADEPRRAERREPAPIPEPGARHVIIAGYGVIGRALADRFATAGIAYTVIELNPATVRKQTRLGHSIVYGDVSNREVLESAGIENADAILLTVPDEEALFRACPVVRSLAPHALIAARTSYLSQAMVLMTLGADIVTVEEVATAEAMANQVLARLETHRMDKAVGPA